MTRTKDEKTGLYCGPCRWQGGANVYLTKDATTPMRVCQTTIELIAYLNGWGDCKKYNDIMKKWG